MNGETTGRNLLEAVLETLEKEVAPALSGDARFRARMLASALGMAIREAERGEALAEAAEAVREAAAARLGRPVADDAALCRALRAGRLAGDAALHRALHRSAVIAAAITRPAALRPEERALAGLDDAGGH